MFGSRKSRQEKGMEIANKVASGKGFYGRLTKMSVGAEDFAAIQESVGAMNSGLDVRQLLAMGVPTLTATVVSIADTGRLVNFDPVVDLVVQPDAGPQRIALRTIVSKLQVPRVNDQVLLVSDPQRPGSYLYAGASD